MQASEDSVPVGNMRQAMGFMGLPYPLIVVMGALGYVVQINVTGWKGAAWGLAVVAPAWTITAIALARDPFGAYVGMAWLRCCAVLRDPMKLGAPSLSPLPANRPAPRGRITHV